MLEYIERKGILGQDGSLAVQKSAAATRTGVELANCVDFARRTRDGRISFFILIRQTGGYLQMFRLLPSDWETSWMFTELVK